MIRSGVVSSPHRRAAQLASALHRERLSAGLHPSSLSSVLSGLVLLPLSLCHCRHAHQRSRNSAGGSAIRYSLPPLSAFPSPSAYTQHILSSRKTPTQVKLTLTTARVLLGPDGFELLLSLLTSPPSASTSPASSPSSPQPHEPPTQADIDRLMEEVRPFAEEHHREKQQAKLRLIEGGKPSPPSGKAAAAAAAAASRDAAGSGWRLDKKAWGSLSGSLASIAHFLIPAPQKTAAATPVASAPPVSPSASSSRPVSEPGTEGLLQLFQSLLPPIQFQLLLRDVVLDNLRPFHDPLSHHALLSRIRFWLTWGEKRRAVVAFKRYKMQRQREKVDVSVVDEYMEDVKGEEVDRLLRLAEVAASRRVREGDAVVSAEGEGEVASRERASALQETEREREIVVKVQEGEAERKRLEEVRAAAESLSLPPPPSLPAYHALSPLPIDFSALHSDLLPPPHWTLSDLKWLHQLQEAAHPLAYHHFRYFMAQVAAAVPGMKPAALPGLVRAFTSYTALLFPASRLLSSLPPHLPRFLSLPAHFSSSPSGSRQSAAVSALSTPLPFPLPLERHAFLAHLLREALPCHWGEIFLAYYRWGMSRLEAERAAAAGGAEAMRRLDTEIDRVKRERDSRQSEDHRTERDDLQPASSLAAAAAEAPDTAEKEQKLHSETDGAKPGGAAAAAGDAEDSKPRPVTKGSVLSLASRLLGSHSPLLSPLRLFIDQLLLSEWREARRQTAESEDVDYLAFHLDESVPASAPAVSPYHQQYAHPLLEYSPAVCITDSASSPAFVSFRERHARHKLFLHNLPVDMAARELLFALRRVGEVRGGEIFRERLKIGPVGTELLRLRERRDRGSRPAAGGKEMKVLRVLGPSPVYACVYFSPSSAQALQHAQSLSLFGLHYRSSSLFPVLAASLSRITIASPALRHSFSYPNLVQHLTAMTLPLLQHPSHLLSIGSRQSLIEQGSVVISLRSHEDAVKVWSALRSQLFAGRRCRVSWLIEEKEKFVVSGADEQDDQQQNDDEEQQRDDDQHQHQQQQQPAVAAGETGPELQAAQMRAA